MRMATKYLAITLFFSVVVIKPVTDRFADQPHRAPPNATIYGQGDEPEDPPWGDTFATDYLWMYLVFAYFFSGVALYLIISETRTVIEIRQEYLGSQTTTTDRTFRLSGIPPDMRSEQRVKDFIEELAIGQVEGVTLCCDWKELDDAMAERISVLRKLEECLTVFYGFSRPSGNGVRLDSDVANGGRYTTADGYHEETYQDNDSGLGVGPPDRRPSNAGRVRPKSTIRFGRLNLRSREVDAIDCYREQLRAYDDKINELREKEFEPTPMAFVTMDTVASCQMAVQAVLDPSPLQLLATQSPAPSEIVWQNTYLSRTTRMVRAWSITAIILGLSVFWFVVFIPLATALNTEAIAKVIPQLATWLDAHKAIRSLVQTQLPTLFLSLLTVIVPYVYEWLANRQGMTSQSEVELSVISKNFFFVFFNFFVIFTILGTASNFYSLLKEFGDTLKDTSRIAWTLAESLANFQGFYVNFLILQGLGLFPFRLLEIGAVFLYPIYRLGAKTPRDYAELAQAPVFSYGLNAPQTLLIFIICITYSVLQDSWKILLAGFAYFVIGSFVYRYQLLYAMDHKQHLTGRSWIMICDRFLVGLVFFQLTVGGQLAAKNAPFRGAMIVPLLVGTIWFSYSYNRTYRPLMSYIALKSVRRAENYDQSRYTDVNDLTESMARWRSESDLQHAGEISRGHDQDSVAEAARFINPNLVTP